MQIILSLIKLDVQIMGNYFVTSRKIQWDLSLSTKSPYCLQAHTKQYEKMQKEPGFLLYSRQ